jgi:hypothetical protein
MKQIFLFILFYSLIGFSYSQNGCKNDFRTFTIFSEKYLNITFGILSDAKMVKTNPPILIFDSNAQLKHKILYYHSTDELMNIATSL